MSSGNRRSGLHISHPIAQTLASAAILIGTGSAQVAQVLPNPWSRDGEIVGRRLTANVHLEDDTRAENNSENLADAPSVC